ncbi:MAG: lysylphosphatidylglycerol synthase transmembrane domain-containing protein [Thermoleophilia bacterium]|nr:flippase-like domain-containing protein [Gaiellaceae bacterium]MDW8339302.1 lysylphosphatidylglycerol synthase transmembrane domain-containing protein [Thermoleophilia bacterium]
MRGARRIARNGWAQAGAAAIAVALVAILLRWRGPDWGAVWGAFHLVVWSWIALAILLNVVSTAFRALSWSLTIGQALPRELHPRLLHVLSAFGVGLLANAVVPGRIGELARVATLRRHLPGAPSGTSVALVGTVVAHRLFDLVPATLLVAWVLLAAEVPHWAIVGLLGTTGIGFALFALAWLSAKRQHRPIVREGASSLRHLVAMARRGLSVLKAPLPLAGAVLLQCLGWLVQLFAVYATMQAFSLDVPLPAAGLVLCLVNVATIVPLWPGNVGLVQAAVALPLLNYGVAYPLGFAYGLVLQGIEMGVGVGLGLAALAREGISFAMLRRMPAAEEAEEVLDEVRELVEELDEEAAREGAPLSR